MARARVPGGDVARATGGVAAPRLESGTPERSLIGVEKTCAQLPASAAPPARSAASAAACSDWMRAMGTGSAAQTTMATPSL